jgi:hypothetical protein
MAILKVKQLPSSTSAAALKQVCGCRIEFLHKLKDSLHNYLCRSHRVLAAVAHPEEAIGVPSGVKNCTEAAVVTNSSGVFISIVCVIVCDPFSHVSTAIGFTS